MSKTIWSVDRIHSSVHFSVRHLMVARVTGRFRGFSGELALDERDLSRSTVALTIDAQSVDTGNEDRDASLRSPRFFDADQFPAVTFESRAVEHLGGDAYRIQGELTIRGVTRPVVIDAELGGFITDTRGARRCGLTARGSILRSEFGMVFNQFLEAGGVAIGDRVEIVVELETIAAAALAA